MSKSNLYSRMASETLKQGAVYALVNAFQLYGDAMIMKSLDRLPREYSFTKLALEEVAKALMLFELFIMKKSNFPDLENTERYQTIIKGLEEHNDKTEYAFQFLLMKQRKFIETHPNKSLTLDSPVHGQLYELEALMERIKELNGKKNTNLYTSLINNKFLPPNLSYNEEDIQNITHWTYKLLMMAKSIIIKDEQEYYSSIGLDFNMEEKLDPYLEVKAMDLLLRTYWNKQDELRSKYPKH